MTFTDQELLRERREACAYRRFVLQEHPRAIGAALGISKATVGYDVQRWERESGCHYASLLPSDTEAAQRVGVLRPATAAKLADLIPFLTAVAA